VWSREKGDVIAKLGNTEGNRDSGNQTKKKRTKKGMREGTGD